MRARGRPPLQTIPRRRSRGPNRPALGLGAGHRPEHIRIGVLGVTGAGKSTFINALLQRYVAPSASTICSAVVVEFVEAESRAKEGFEVTFLPQNERTQRIKRESASCQEAEKQAQKLPVSVKVVAARKFLTPRPPRCGEPGRG